MATTTTTTSYSSLLADSIAAVTKGIAGEHRLKVYVTSSAPSSSTEKKHVGSIVDSHPTVKTDRSVLVTQAQKNGDKEVEMLVYGLAVSEFRFTNTAVKEGNTTTNITTLVYLEKIDSTGYGNLPSISSTPKATTTLARALVHGYLDFARSGLVNAKDSSHHRVLVHIFGRAQPQYLFPESARNSSKHVLDDRGLLRWWRKTLSTYATVNDDKGKSKAIGKWLFVPGEDRFPMFLNDTVDPSTNWKYGLPYPSNAVARKVIPKFPDDAKTKLFTSGIAESPTTTVQEFLELLSSTGEFAGGRVAGFLGFELCVKHLSDSIVPTFTTSDEDLVHHLDKQLMRTDFRSREDAFKSSKTVIEWMTSKGAQVVSKSVTVTNPVEVDTTAATVSSAPVVVNNLTSLIKKKSTAATTAPAPTTTAAPVNSLQGLVKRKDAAPTASLTTNTSGNLPAVNNLQSLVKKKPVETATPVNDLQGLVKRKAEASSGQDDGVKKSRAE